MKFNTTSKRHWLIAYVCCVVLWVALDAALQCWGFFMFENFLRLPLITAVEYLGSLHQWCLVLDFPFWSVGTLMLAGYAALGFLPLVFVPLLRRKWPLLLTGAFILAHPAMWVLVLANWLSGSHP